MDSYKTQLKNKDKEIEKLTEENARVSQENGYLLRSRQKVQGQLNSQVKETEQQLTERKRINVSKVLMTYNLGSVPYIAKKIAFLYCDLSGKYLISELLYRYKLTLVQI